MRPVSTDLVRERIWGREGKHIAQGATHDIWLQIERPVAVRIHDSVANRLRVMLLFQAGEYYPPRKQKP